jgi:hypothetical protein
MTFQVGESLEKETRVQQEEKQLPHANGATFLIDGLIFHICQISEYLVLRRRLSQVRRAGGSLGYVLLQA